MKTTTIQAGERPVREINEEIQALVAQNFAVEVQDTLARHNLGVGLPMGAQLRFDGSVGYYCGGLNNGAEIWIEGNSGWGTGEAMAAGHITVNGYSGMSTGAAMLGGTIHVKGDCGPRCGVAMKGGDIIVEGKLGYQSGFMAHGGRIIALDGAAGSCADALWEGEVWVVGKIESLGVDTNVIEPSDSEVEAVEFLLKKYDLDDASHNWQKIVAGQRLWYFESRDAKSWLMI